MASTFPFDVRVYSRCMLCWIAVLDSSASACSITAATTAAATELNYSHLSYFINIISTTRTTKKIKEKEVT